ncbi:hypothetical protein FOE78_17260 [Microlunatus elymi]|uniref:Alpha amylase inhibitor n=1 Tax=Microlunatus elymi TaxID=2596828 RepID=A0A516Q1X0_9ACTN|nr:hypothetical protein FOE78_17260 [Microlunatus elymi]
MTKIRTGLTLASAGVPAISALTIAAPNAAAATAPSCVRKTSQSPIRVTVQNDCTHAVRVKVVFKFAPDTKCASISAGQRYTFSHLAGSFDYIATC